LYVRRGEEDCFVAKEVRRSIYFIFLPAIFLATPSAAQTNDQLVGAFKAIAGSWQTLIQKQTPILKPCANGKWEAIRLSPNSTVSFDLKKTDSLVSPYVGIIRIFGTVEENEKSSHANGFQMKDLDRAPADLVRDPEKTVTVCFQTPEQALADPEFRDWIRNAAEREYIANHNFNEGSFVLSGGNQIFENLILEALNASAQRGLASVAGLMGSSKVQ
jgi:hypothetical protein